LSTAHLGAELKHAYDDSPQLVAPADELLALRVGFLLLIEREQQALFGDACEHRLEQHPGPGGVHLREVHHALHRWRCLRTDLVKHGVGNVEAARCLGVLYSTCRHGLYSV